MATQQTTTTSKQFTLNISDVWKGLIVSVLSSVITIVVNTLQQGSLTFDWKAIGITALTTGLAYIMKNFFTVSKIVVKDAPQSTVDAVKEGEAEVVVKPT